MYAFLMDWKCPLNYCAILIKLFCYPSHGAGNVLSGCLAFSGLFEGMDIPFTLFIALRCVLNKSTVCLWTMGEILFETDDNGRYAPANISSAVLLANFLSPHLHNQRNVWYIEIDFMLKYCSA